MKRIILIISGLILLGAIFVGLKKENFFLNIAKPSSSQLTPTPIASFSSCTRTTRLDNKPQYDRALSLIEEKYSSWEAWEKNGGSSPWYSFPSQLTNCIQVIESDVRDSKEVEGYFVFNDENIKDNYFPIYVDKSYRNSDDIINALLLIHEITHVRQFLDTLEGKDNLSCINKEVEAFYVEYRFYMFQPDEVSKSVDLRMKYDENLNPQLQVIKAIRDYILSEKFIGLNELCKDESPSNTCSDIIEADLKRQIKVVVSNDEYYRKQCEL